MAVTEGRKQEVGPDGSGKLTGLRLPVTTTVLSLGSSTVFMGVGPLLLWLHLSSSSETGRRSIPSPGRRDWARTWQVRASGGASRLQP